MIVYTGLLLFSLCSLFIYKRTNKDIFSILPYVFMAFVSGFRSNVGTDYRSYVDIFSAVSANINNWSNVEYAVRCFISFLNTIGANYQVFFLTFSVLTSYYYYKFIKDNSKDFMLSTVVYLCIGPFYLSTFNTVRQGLATAICMHALKYCYKNQKKFFCYIIIASLFHRSALLFIFMPLTKRIKKRYKLYTGILCVGMLSLLWSGIIQFILEELNLYSIYSGLGSYWNSSFLIFLFIALFVLMMDKIINSLDKQYALMICLAIALIVCGYGYGSLSIIFIRILLLVIPVFILAVPEIINIFVQKEFVKQTAYLFCIAYYFLVINTGANMLPYAFNFNLLGK